MQGMIRRDAEAQIRSLALGFPAVAVIGPRQSGKTTLVRSVFPQLPYVLLEDPDTRAFAEEDPRSFLAQYEKTGAILDEVQRVPELFSYLSTSLTSSSPFFYSTSFSSPFSKPNAVRQEFLSPSPSLPGLLPRL